LGPSWDHCALRTSRTAVDRRSSDRRVSPVSGKLCQSALPAPGSEEPSRACARATWRLTSLRRVAAVRVRLAGAIAEHLENVTIHLSLTHEADTTAAVVVLKAIG
jgi:hypothetical protein